MADMSNAEVALLQDRDGMFGGNAMFFWIFALLILAGGGLGGLGLGGNPGYVTQAELTAGLNNNATQAQLQAIAMATENNKFETARIVGEQTNQILQQNNTNLINAIQGFNQVNQNLTNQTNVLSQQIQALDAKVSSCCCEIKTMMLQNRLDEAERRNVVLQNSIDNANQSQYILGQLGRFVAWAGSGSQAAAVAGT